MLDAFHERRRTIMAWLFRSKFVKPGLVLVGVLMLGTLGLTYFESVSPANALWWTVVTISTVGYGDIAPATVGGRLVGVVAMLSGIGLLSAVSATLASMMVSSDWKKAHGMGLLSCKDHFIICGWNHKAREMIYELRADQGAQHTPITLIADVPELPVEVEEVSFVRGDVTPETMRQANMRDARAIVILGDEQLDAFSRDARAILTTLTVKNQHPDLYTCVELADATNATHCQLAGADEIIVGGALTSHLLVLAALDPGVTRVVSELLSRHVGTHELYLTPIAAEFVGQRFLDTLTQLKQDEGMLVLGVQHVNGHHTINPSPTYTLQTGDQLFIVAMHRPDFSKGVASQ